MDNIALVSCPGFADTVKIFIPTVEHPFSYSISKETPEDLCKIIKEYNISKIIFDGFVPTIQVIEKYIKTVAPEMEIEIGE